MSGTLLAAEGIPERNQKTLIKKVLAAYRYGGFHYVWHKSMRRGLEKWPSLKRRAIYSDPRDYWTLRGGMEYLTEQEGQPARTQRSLWLAGKVASCQPLSILEVGCGYGKQIKNIRALISNDVSITGVDYSPSQLSLAEKHLADQKNIRLARASGERLPFADETFDLVLTSAVILHNPPHIAEKIRQEILRVTKKWCLHNEDTDITYNRYGYDTAEWYRNRGIAVVESGPIPADVFQRSDDPVGESLRSQFCMVKL